jgi:quinol monooxygenase YgiN
MVVEYIRYTIDSERAQVFEQAYRRAAVALDASEHCVRYEVSRCSDDATQYVVRIDWDSEEGHLSGFRRSPEFRSFFEAVGPFVHDIDEMRHYQVTFASDR